jgi:hypothetical protein
MTLTQPILEGPITPAECSQPIINLIDKGEYDKAVSKCVDELIKMEQVDAPVEHKFSPGVYVRQITMPAGTFVIGHKHKTQHLNIVMTGRAKVMMNGIVEEIVAPCIFESQSGVQKVLLIEEDMVWATVHTNPENCQDVVKLEESLIDVSEEFLKAKGSLTVDEFRMSGNLKLKEEA